VNPLVLRALAHDLDAACRGRAVRRAGLLNPQELGLVLSGHGEPLVAVLAAWPGAPHVRLEPSTRFNRRLTDQLGEAPALLAGAVLTAVETLGMERVLRLALQPYQTSRPSHALPLAIFFELLPRTPFLIVTSGGNVVTAVRAPGTRRPDTRRMERGAPYLLPFDLGPPQALPPAKAVLESRLAAASGADPMSWALALAPQLRGVVVEHLAAILTGARDVNDAASRLLAYRGPVVMGIDAEGAPELVPEVISGSGEGEDSGGGEGGRALGVLAVVREWARLRLQHESAGRLRTALGRALLAETAALARARQALGRDTRKLGDPAKLRRQGEILLAHLHRITPGSARVELPDPYGGETIAIDLDPRRTPAANAEACFQAARRAERAAEKLAARTREHDERALILAASESRLAEIGPSSLDAAVGLARDLAAKAVLPAESVNEMVGAAQAQAEGGPREIPTGAKRREPPSRLPYRPYPLPGGWEVWVGRSSADNDVLTHELARPHDVWLHARGAAGSHVVLRRSDGSRAVPPRAVIETAASYAAFFSQARHSRLVPVIVTEKRYVRKPRRSPPGTAVCLREKTVMAAPRRPAGGGRAEQD
jgi:predicted ribosome quality control (RQC) complex YloA/Tae2 family protein